MGVVGAMLVVWVGALVGIAPPASAASACVFDPAGAAVSVSLAPSPTGSTLSRTPQGAITVDGIPCGAATVHNTDTITVSGAPNAPDVLLIDLRNGRLAPGRSPEPGPDEIEVSVDLGSFWERNGTVQVVLGNGNDSIGSLSSTTGVDLDAGGESPDDDLLFTDVNALEVYGEGGNDTIDVTRLGLAASYIYGGPGDDSITGTSMWLTDTRLYGDHAFGENPQLPPSATGADVLTGYGRLQGGLGDDTMIATGPANFVAEKIVDGSDVMRGEDSRNAVDYSLRADGVEVSLDGLANDGDPTGSGERDLVGAGIDEINGGTGDDLIVGGPGNEILYGGDGSDHVVGGGGDDTLQGGIGDDFVEGGPGADVLFGEWTWDKPADDVMDGGEGDDLIMGGSGRDRLSGGPGNDRVYGGDVPSSCTFCTRIDSGDEIDGGEGDDTLDGDLGDDRLTGGPGRDTLTGREGADYFVAFDLEADTVDGGADLDIDVCKCDAYDTMTNIP
jgi:Ca2+-binding RTX toxin-like protein